MYDDKRIYEMLLLVMIIIEHLRVRSRRLSISKQNHTWIIEKKKKKLYTQCADNFFIKEIKISLYFDLRKSVSHNIRDTMNHLSI